VKYFLIHFGVFHGIQWEFCKYVLRQKNWTLLSSSWAELYTPKFRLGQRCLENSLYLQNNLRQSNWVLTGFVFKLLCSAIWRCAVATHVSEEPTVRWNFIVKIWLPVIWRHAVATHVSEEPTLRWKFIIKKASSAIWRLAVATNVLGEPTGDRGRRFLRCVWATPHDATSQKTKV
jgi:hypothetical protein